jgi:hypothetical protein
MIAVFGEVDHWSAVARGEDEVFFESGLKAVGGVCVRDLGGQRQAMLY